MEMGALRRSKARAAAAAAMALLVGPAAVEARIEQAQPRPTERPELRIEITGYEFQWHVRYPGPDGELGTADDLLDRQDVRVPVGRHVELVLHSLDYLYTLALPHASLKEIAVPDLTFSLRLTPDQVGSFELRGDQFCGYSHPDLMGNFVVMTESDFEKWTREGLSSSRSALAPE
jgi:cytochrome c oxidase subunit 2